MNRCVKCGGKVYEKRRLRCKDCMKFVDAELKGIFDRPLNFYFTYYNKCKKSNVLDVEKK